MSNVQTILIKSNDAQVAEIASTALNEAEGYRLMFCDDDRAAMRRLDEVHVNLMLYDYQASVSDDESALIRCRLAYPSCARITLFDAAVEAEGVGATDRAAAFVFLKKPVNAAQLRLATKRALEQVELSRRHRILTRELKLSVDDDLFTGRLTSSVQGGYSQFERLVFVSAKMADLVEEARIAAKTNMPVLIQGDTGTGKELLARAIHFNSQRRNSPMHVQNCGGIADVVLQSELFGHVRGAFPGAISDRLGLFRAADGGTIFLDEISEISAQFQVALLRFLQEGEVKPLGSDEMLHSNVRIIAASNKSIEGMVEQGRFRRDLFYRLRGFQLQVPTLAERPEDIPLLTQFFVEKYAGVVGRRVLGVTTDALRRLEAYPFPGNVRELENEVQRMVAVAEQGGYIAWRHLSERISRIPIREEGTGGFVPVGSTLKDMVESLERAIVAQALDRSHWNQSKVAQDLGLSRVGLANKIKRYDLTRKKR
ncbi:two component Fis family sigma54 specific transcriptional regulator [Phreatobacter oligotrophus]|jgi:two-component system response regulator HupR/HoxA|uniref:Two component Fis family sigma54 specific transcriptional regulator n=2 Tax=Phreatobacter oligotrophus TaxID=1122261 RepID=A0A2T4YWU9_9HYPH|nr:two component Fis family sigma54 specific transcriptional regulator [Phreatobacter oligotrophus]